MPILYDHLPSAYADENHELTYDDGGSVGMYVSYSSLLSRLNGIFSIYGSAKVSHSPIATKHLEEDIGF
jgi:hypothetical protein